MPDVAVFAAPSMTRFDSPELGASRMNPALPAATVTFTGVATMADVSITTFLGTRMGNVSPLVAGSKSTSCTVVPAAAFAPRNSRALVMVLKGHVEAPVCPLSLPAAGSTYRIFPVAALQAVHTLPVHVSVEAQVVVFVAVVGQQLPATHSSPLVAGQHTSPELAAQALLTVPVAAVPHVAGTQAPVP